METHQDVRLRALKADISARLRSVCADWPEPEFEAMIDRLARITLKYAAGTTVGSYDRRSTDRLVTELREALARSETARGETPPPKNRARRTRGTRGKS